MKILIVDNSQIINERLKAMISEAYSPAIIYQATSYDEAIKLLLTESKPDVVVLDVGLPANMAADLLTVIKALKNKTVVIVLSMSIDRLTWQKYTTAGADFFLDKYHEFGKVAGIINKISND